MIYFNIGFQICAIIVLLLIHIMFRIYRKIFLIRERVFYFILNLATIEVTLDIIYITAILMNGYISEGTVYILARLYLLSIVIFSSGIFLYVLTEIYQGNVFDNKKRYIFILVDAIAFPILLNLKLFIVNGNICAIYGPAVIAAFVMCASYLLLSIYYIYKKSEYIVRIKAIAIICSCLALSIAAFLQMVIFEIRIFSVTISVVLIYLYYCLESPGEYIDGTLGVFNHEAYQMYMKNRISNKKSVSLLYIRIADYSKMTEVFGNGLRTIFIKKLCNYLNSFENAKTFYLGNGELIMAFEEEAFFIKYFQQIRKRLSEVWNVSEKEDEIVEIEVNSVVIAYPGERMEDNLTLDNVMGTLEYYIAKYRTSSKNEFLCIDRREIREKDRYDHVVASMKEAIEENRVDVFFQSIYSVADDKTVGLEALMRVSDERGVYLDNEMVIDYAEKTGQIRTLGNVVLKKVCSFVRTHSLYELEIYTINVNLSVLQCQDSRLAADFIDIMDSYQLPASMFRFEISSALTSYATVNFKKNIERLTEVGAEFIIDNYGQAATDIEKMLQMKLNAVKLSPKTIRDYFANAKVRNSVRIDCQLLRQMNITVMAVGVENQQQYNELKKLGIAYMQGNEFYRPMDGIAILKAISKERDNGIEREALYERVL